jgi:hypothetical protein
MIPRSDVPQQAPDPDANGHAHPTVDIVAETVDRVRAELAERRARGELPRFPPEEMRRHFDAVVEAYEGALLQIPRVESDDRDGERTPAGMAPGRSPVPGVSAARKMFNKAIRRLVRLLASPAREFTDGLVKRVDHIAERQDRMRRFLLVAHLDRVRQLEYRVAQLELELERARASAANNA